IHATAQRLVADFVTAFPDADACVFAVNATQDALVVAHATARISDAVAALRIALGSGVSGWVAANRSAIRRAGPVLDLAAIAPDFGLRRWVGAPVLVRADLFGVVSVYAGADTPMSDERVADVGLLAQEVGLAIARGAAPFHLHLRSAARPVAA